MTTARYTQRTDDPHPVRADIARSLLATGMSDAAFGKRALGDPNFVEDMRYGRDLRRTTERRVRGYMARVAISNATQLDLNHGSRIASIPASQWLPPMRGEAPSVERLAALPRSDARLGSGSVICSRSAVVP